MNDLILPSEDTASVEVFLAAEQCVRCGTAHELVHHSRYVDDDTITTRWSCGVCGEQHIDTVPIHEAEAP